MLENRLIISKTMNYKSLQFLLLGIISILTASCQQDELSGSPYEVTIDGNNCEEYLPEGGSRSRVSTYNLSQGSEISFFAQGGFNADNIRMTYDGAQWRGNAELKWGNTNNGVTVTAYSPYMASGTDIYTAEGSLKDILYAKQSYAYGENISLQFSHLFAEVTFQVASSINKQISSVVFTPSLKATAVDFATTEVAVTANTDYSTTTAHNNEGIYKIIIPAPAQEMQIDIKVNMQDGTSRKTVCKKVFQKGVSYYCNVSDDSKGIYTEEDFIAFTELMNGITTSGRDLSEFGQMTDGKKTYYLRNSLSFSPEQNKRLKLVGYFKNMQNYIGFDDVFDGMYNTLSGLDFTTISASNDNISIFPYNNGEIRNLIVDNTKIIPKKGSKITTMAAICNYNCGSIHNCIIKNVRIDNTTETYSSILATINLGSIYNCGIEHSNIYNTKYKAGGMAYDNKGMILNSYIYNSSIIEGGYICYNNYKEIRGCYTHAYKVDTKRTKAVCQEHTGKDAYINSVFFQKDFDMAFIGKITTTNEAQTNVIHYITSTFKTDRSKEFLVDRMNKWRNEYAKAHPEYELATWTRTSADRPVFSFDTTF